MSNKLVFDKLVTDRKITAEKLRSFADDVESGKVHGFVLGAWYGHNPTGDYSHTVTALWENPDPSIPPAITTLVGVATLLQDRALREFHSTDTRRLATMQPPHGKLNG